MLCTKISLQGSSQIVLILILHSLFAHAEASLTYNSLFDRCFVILLYKFSNEVLSIGIFMPPHHTLFSVILSLTIYLSFGDLPVNLPVFTERTPSLVSCPKLLETDILVRSDTGRL